MLLVQTKTKRPLKPRHLKDVTIVLVHANLFHFFYSLNTKLKYLQILPVGYGRACSWVALFIRRNGQIIYIFACSSWLILKSRQRDYQIGKCCRNICQDFFLEK